MIPDHTTIAAHQNRAVAETMETMAFLEVSPGPDVDGPPPDSLLCTIAFIAPYQGQLTLALPPDIARQIALALVDSDDQDVVRDIVNEITNTIAGRLLGLVAPPGEQINVGLPQPDTPADDTITWTAYRLDDGRSFRVGMHMVTETQ